MRSLRLIFIGILLAGLTVFLELALPHGCAHAAVPPSGPSGQPMPRGDLPGWRQVFADDFTRNVPLGQFPAAVQAKWGHSYPDGWPDTTGHGTYEPTRTVGFSRGMMILRLLTEKSGRIDVAAPLPSLAGLHGALGMKYGRYEVRYKADSVAGFKTAWMLWPDSNKRSEGEIDFPEANLNGYIFAFTHHQGATSGGDQDGFHSRYRDTSWHTALTNWTPGNITYYLDGHLIGHSAYRVPDTPMHWVLQTETSTPSPVPSPAAVAHVYVDWAVAYAYTPGKG